MLSAGGPAARVTARFSGVGAISGALFVQAWEAHVLLVSRAVSRGVGAAERGVGAAERGVCSADIDSRGVGATERGVWAGARADGGGARGPLCAAGGTRHAPTLSQADVDAILGKEIKGREMRDDAGRSPQASGLGDSSHS